MVALLADSGFFDWAAVKMYEMSKGRIWVLITLLNLVTAVLSAFLVGMQVKLLVGSYRPTQPSNCCPLSFPGRYASETPGWKLSPYST